MTRACGADQGSACLLDIGGVDKRDSGCMGGWGDQQGLEVQLPVPEEACLLIPALLCCFLLRSNDLQS